MSNEILFISIVSWISFIIYKMYSITHKPKSIDISEAIEEITYPKQVFCKGLHVRERAYYVKYIKQSYYKGIITKENAITIGLILNENKSLLYLSQDYKNFITKLIRGKVKLNKHPRGFSKTLLIPKEINNFSHSHKESKVFYSTKMLKTNKPCSYQPYFSLLK